MVNVLPQVAKLKGIALDILFPKYCVGCGKEGGFVCPSCCQSLSRITPPVCPKCGKPQTDELLCHDCTDWQASIDGIRSPLAFEGAIRQAIHQLKYRNLRALTSPLAVLLEDYLMANPLPAEVLVPVPLHPRRLRERGYNQSGHLARELGKLIKTAVVDDCLVRQRHTSPQATTSNVEERRSNISDAFTCNDHRLQGKQVLLIDDVATSGATLDACAAAVKASGAASVWGLVMAREL
ncbi:ComF family protein [Chloroflexota bacterium]